jgi:hypothetical protein
MTKDHKQLRLGDFGLAKEVKGDEYTSGDAGVRQRRSYVNTGD